MMLVQMSLWIFVGVASFYPFVVAQVQDREFKLFDYAKRLMRQIKLVNFISWICEDLIYID